MSRSLLLDGAYIFCASAVQQHKCLHMIHPVTVNHLGAWEQPWVLGLTKPAMEH